MSAGRKTMSISVMTGVSLLIFRTLCSTRSKLATLALMTEELKKKNLASCETTALAILLEAIVGRACLKSSFWMCRRSMSC